MTNLKEEMLTKIDNIDTVTFESAVSVFSTLTNAYEKTSMIMENYTGDDYSHFAIFQEADATAADGEPDKGPNGELFNKKPVQQESTLKKIIMFIPNMIKKFFKWLKSLWTNDVVPAVDKTTDDVKKKLGLIQGKDESWIKKHAKELGIAGAAITLAATAAVLIKNVPGKIAATLTNWIRTNPVTQFFKISAEKAKAGVMCKMREGEIWMNLKMKSLANFFKKAIPVLAKGNKGVLDDNPEAVQNAANELKNIQNQIINDGILENDLMKLDVNDFVEGFNDLCSSITDAAKALGTAFTEVPKDLVNQVNASTTKISAKLVENWNAVGGGALTIMSSFAPKCQGIKGDVAKLAAHINKLIKKLIDSDPDLADEEENTDETKSDETKPEETKSEETKSDETKSDENTADETKSDETSKPAADDGDAEVKFVKGKEYTAEEVLPIIQKIFPEKKVTVDDGALVVGKTYVRNGIKLADRGLSKDSEGTAIRRLSYKSGKYVFEYAVDDDDDDYEDASESKWYNI